jgi:hypothetical protein
MTTLHRSLSHRLVSSITLLGNGLQEQMFLCFCVHVLTGWKPSHAILTFCILASASTYFGCQFPCWIDFQLPNSSFSCHFSTGFRTELTGFQLQFQIDSVRILGMSHIEKTTWHSSSTVVCTHYLLMAQVLLHADTVVA